MPDSKGRLSEEERSRAHEWITKKAQGTFNCTLCKSNQWTLADHIVSLPVSNAQGFVGTPDNPLVTLPQIHFFCEVCGRGEFINALYTGVIKSETEETENNNPSTALSDVIGVQHG